MATLTHSGIEHCRDAQGLGSGTTGMGCWALVGPFAVEHCRETLGWELLKNSELGNCMDTLASGTAGHVRRAATS